ncbi:Alba domain containing protein [Trichuris trichiura]|uniref:Alba domain containing protein n=1 Tax=Trichuris trichiura TaxID=36087 RepID=A0A077YXC1_TRITR|nr:Alba domain containing protein [Trichuris trichiura]
MCKDCTNSMFDGQNYELRWRKPTQAVRGRNDIFISKKTHPKGLLKTFLKIIFIMTSLLAAYMKRCLKVLNSGEEAVYLHGLGSAVNRTIALALRLKREALGSLDVDVSTTSVTCTGDMVPLDDDVDYKEVTKYTSAIHVKVFKPTAPVKNY